MNSAILVPAFFLHKSVFFPIVSFFKPIGFFKYRTIQPTRGDMEH